MLTSETMHVVKGHNIVFYDESHKVFIYQFCFCDHKLIKDVGVLLSLLFISVENCTEQLYDKISIDKFCKNVK